MTTLKTLSAMVAILLAVGEIALADGGTIRLMEQRDDIQVTVFTLPAPLRAGPIDVSVLVQNTNGNAVASNVIVVAKRVSAHSSADSTGPVLRIPASQASATNQLLQAAKFSLPEAGLWSFDVVVKGNDDTESKFTFEAEAAPALGKWTTYWLWFSWPLVIIFLFGYQQRTLRSTDRLSRRESL